MVKAASAVDGQLLNNVQILDHVLELLKRNLAISVLVSLNDCSVHKLLQLHVVQVAANHHLEHLEKFAIGDEAIVVNVVDLESEAQLLLGGGGCG